MSSLRAEKNCVKIPSGILHMPVLNHTIGEGENVRDNAPIELQFSHVCGRISYIHMGATYKKAVENTSTNWFRFDLDICSCVTAGSGNMKMYRSKRMPNADCTIPQ